MIINPMHPINTGRAVDARWQWICELYRTRRNAVMAYDDIWIGRGLAYVRRMKSCRGRADFARIERDYADIVGAQRLRFLADKMDRAVVEARLLSGQSIEEVAQACNKDVGTLIAYEKLFFQVLGRLEARSFIYFDVIGIDPAKDPGEDDTDMLLKLYAYQKGPLFMELVLRYFRNGIKMPERLDDASIEELDELAMMLRIRAVILARVLPYPKCRRAQIWMDLADEVGAHALSRNGPDMTSSVHHEFDVTEPTLVESTDLGAAVDHGETPDWPLTLPEVVNAA